MDASSIVKRIVEGENCYKYEWFCPILNVRRCKYYRNKKLVFGGFGTFKKFQNDNIENFLMYENDKICDYSIMVCFLNLKKKDVTIKKYKYFI